MLLQLATIIIFSFAWELFQYSNNDDLSVFLVENNLFLTSDPILGQYSFL